MSENVKPIRVLVVDDSPFMRKMLSMMLEKCADVHVVGTAMNGQDAIAQVQRTQPRQCVFPLSQSMCELLLQLLRATRGATLLSVQCD